MRGTVLAAVFMLLVGCGDDEPETGSAQFGATCTTVSDESTECESGVCTDAFDMLGNVCSVKCTQADPSVCPSGSEGQKCNMKGYCRP